MKFEKDMELALRFRLFISENVINIFDIYELVKIQYSKDKGLPNAVTFGKGRPLKKSIGTLVMYNDHCQTGQVTLHLDKHKLVPKKLRFLQQLVAPVATLAS